MGEDEQVELERVEERRHETERHRREQPYPLGSAQGVPEFRRLGDVNQPGEHGQHKGHAHPSPHPPARSGRRSRFGALLSVGHALRPLPGGCLNARLVSIGHPKHLVQKSSRDGGLAAQEASTFFRSLKVLLLLRSC